MQEPRRRRWLQLHLLPLIVACGAAAPTPAAAPAPVVPVAATTAPPVAVPASEASPEPATASPPGAPLGAELAPNELPRGTKVLQVGDSFADALGKELGKLLREAELRTTLETKTPSYIGDWAYGSKLRKLLANYDPDLVLITLGANEVEVPEPAQRITAVQRLVKQVAARPCVWILPPLWKADTGVMQVIKDHAAPCLVLDSTALVGDLPRGPDRIHPNSQGRADWARAVLKWLKERREPSGSLPWSLRSGEP